MPHLPLDSAFDWSKENETRVDGQMMIWLTVAGSAVEEEERWSGRERGKSTSQHFLTLI
jgi:hypothetical protein